MFSFSYFSLPVEGMASLTEVVEASGNYPIWWSLTTCWQTPNRRPDLRPVQHPVVNSIPQQNDKESTF